MNIRAFDQRMKWSSNELLCPKHISNISSWINSQKILTIEKLANEFEVGQKYRHSQWVTSILVKNICREAGSYTQSIGSMHLKYVCVCDWVL